jgi:hypothetical protein
VSKIAGGAARNGPVTSGATRRLARESNLPGKSDKGQEKRSLNDLKDRTVCAAGADFLSEQGGSI